MGSLLTENSSSSHYCTAAVYTGVFRFVVNRKPHLVTRVATKNNACMQLLLAVCPGHATVVSRIALWGLLRFSKVKLVAVYAVCTPGGALQNM